MLKILAIVITQFLSISFSQEISLTEALKDYQTVQKMLQSITNPPEKYCEIPLSNSFLKTDCTLQSFCQNSKLNYDQLYLYKNAKGESILNEELLKESKNIFECIKISKSDDLDNLKIELTKTYGSNYLKTLQQENKKLMELTAKYNQGSNISKISSDLLNEQLKLGIGSEDSEIIRKKYSRDEINQLLSDSEKRLKIKLPIDLKKSMIEVQYLLRNPEYKINIDNKISNYFPGLNLSNPMLNWSLIYDSSVAGGVKTNEKNQLIYKAKVQKTFGYFQETKKEMIAYLQSTKTTKNSLMIERAIERIDTITFRPMDFSKSDLESCKTPNAYYTPEHHEFFLCPQYLDYPEMSIKETIAHELTHSIDSCAFSKETIQYKSPRVVEDSPIDIDFNLNQSTNKLGLNLNYDIHEDEKAINSKIPFKDHPFYQTIQCLTYSKSANARQLDKDLFIQKNNELLNFLTSIGQNNIKNLKYKNAKYFHDNAEDYFKYYAGCDFSSENVPEANTQLEEAFADKISAEVVNRMLKNKNGNEAKDAILEIASGYSDSCPNVNAKTNYLNELEKKYNCKSFIDNKTKDERIVIQMQEVGVTKLNTHPSPFLRINNILMAHPEIRKKLNCKEDKGVKYCE
jgi:hypothetical protein